MDEKMITEHPNIDTVGQLRAALAAYPDDMNIVCPLLDPIVVREWHDEGVDHRYLTVE